jgi:hypothetical protein
MFQSTLTIPGERTETSASATCRREPPSPHREVFRVFTRSQRQQSHVMVMSTASTNRVLLSSVSLNRSLVLRGKKSLIASVLRRLSNCVSLTSSRLLSVTPRDVAMLSLGNGPVGSVHVRTSGTPNYYQQPSGLITPRNIAVQRGFLADPIGGGRNP